MRRVYYAALSSSGANLTASLVCMYDQVIREAVRVGLMERDGERRREY